MAKSILKILTIFIIGTVGGIFADQILWPYFIERPLFHQYRLEQSPVYVTERKEVTNYIQENMALRQAIEKVGDAVVGIKTETEDGNVLQGSGLVVTTDGLLVTLADLVPQGSDFAFYVDGKWPFYQILKRDLKNNLALVRVTESGLKTTGFADLEKLKLGERVFLIGFDFQEISTTTATSTLSLLNLIVNEGIIKSFNDSLIQTNIQENPVLSGSPLFNIEGNLVGLALIDKSGLVSAVPINLIRQFVGF